MFFFAAFAKKYVSLYPLFVMSPKPDDFDGFYFWQNLINEAMLDVDASGISAGQIAYQLFKRRGIPKGVVFQDFQETLGLFPKSRNRDFFGVLLGLSRINKLPTHQRIFFDSFPTGVSRPFRIDSRMPGTERR